jgi:hypothetical protein
MPFLLHYPITNHNSVVGFDFADHMRHLTLHGERAFDIGLGCETCHFLFERRRSTRLSPEAVSEWLAAGADLLDERLLATVAALLPTGDYAVAVASVVPRRTGPCEHDDYFANESLELFGLDAYSGLPHSPRTPYWRVATAELPELAERVGAARSTGGSASDLFFHFLVPMEPPTTLDPQRVAHYRELLDGTAEPAALGVSILDVRAPAVIPWDKRADASWTWRRHWCLATFVLDGHHKLEAATQAGRSIRMLMLIARDASGADGAEVDRIVRLVAD